MDYKLSEDQLLQYLHNLLDNELKRFNWEKVVDTINNYARAKVFLTRNNGRVSRQARMRQ